VRRARAWYHGGGKNCARRDRDGRFSAAVRWVHRAGRLRPGGGAGQPRQLAHPLRVARGRNGDERAGDPRGDGAAAGRLRRRAAAAGRPRHAGAGRRRGVSRRVCTGSALAARAGLLDDKTATTNRRAFDWVAAQGPRTRWDRTARYTADGRVYTSAGVSAGIDMALGFVCDRFGPETAREIAARKEYRPAPEGRICGIDRPRRT